MLGLTQQGKQNTDAWWLSGPEGQRLAPPELQLPPCHSPACPMTMGRVELADA